MKLTVVLGASSEASFDIFLNDNPFVCKWAKELQWCLDHCEFNQQEAFWSLTSPEESTKILTDACTTINRYLKNFIEIRDNIQSQPQEYFNYLHLKFEQLNGKFDKPTRLFTIANQELKDAIRNLNLFVHRVETKMPAEPSLCITFNKDQYRRRLLAESDYSNFEFKAPPGTLFVHYAELGKEFIDLYEDNLELDYSGFTNLHHYSGESWLTLTEYNPFADKNYYDWLVNRGIDPFNKQLGHGKIPLGTVADPAEVGDKLKKYRYLNGITIHN